jgi:WD40 repeat protein
LTVALSPDGRRALTGHARGILRLWDVTAGKEEKFLAGHTQQVTAAAFAPDGRRAVTGCRGGTVRVWDVDTGTELHCARLRTGPVKAVAFTPDGRHFLAAAGFQTMRIWEASTGEEVYRWAGQATSLAGAAGRLLLAADPNGLSVRRLPGPEHDMGQLVLENDSSWGVQVVVKSKGKQVRTMFPSVGDQGGGQVVELKAGDYELEVPYTSVKLRLSPNRVSVKARRQQVVRLRVNREPPVKPEPQRLAAAEQEWHALQGREAAGADREQLRKDLIEFLHKHRGLPPALEAAAALRRLPSPLDGLERAPVPAEMLARLGDGEPRNAPRNLVTVLAGHAGAVQSLAFRGDGAVLATGGADGLLKLWDLATGKERQSWAAHTGGVRAVAFSPDGTLLASAGQDRRAVLWEPATGKKVRELTGHEGAVRALAFSPDGALLATAGTGPKVRLWRVPTGELWKSLVAQAVAVADLEFSPDGSLLLCADAAGGSHLLAVPTGAIQRSFWGNNKYSRASAFSPDGSLVAVASCWGYGLTLFESASGMQFRTPYYGGGNEGRCLAFRPDGREVAIAASDGSITFWDPDPGAATDDLLIASAANSIVQLAYSPDGRYLAVSHNDGLVSIVRLAAIPPAAKKPK